MNYSFLVGRLTKNLELRKTNTNKSVIKFTIAVQKDKEHTNFINCIVWNKLAETMADFCKKGDLIGIAGEIQTGSYENSKGDKVYTTEVLVNKLTFLQQKAEKEKTEQEILKEVINDDKIYKIEKE